MNPFVPLLLIFGSGAALIVFLLFNFFNQVQPDRVELNFLRKKNLYLAHILRILESSDYQLLSRSNRKYRDYLFVSYAKNLMQDIDELAQLRLGGRAYLYYVFFKLFYVLLIVKNKIYSSVNDLQVLVGIELMLVKRMAG